MKQLIDDLKKRGYSISLHSDSTRESWDNKVYGAIDVSFYFSFDQIFYELEKFQGDRNNYLVFIAEKNRHFFVFKSFFVDGEIIFSPPRFSSGFDYVEGLQVGKIFSKKIILDDYKSFSLIKLPLTNSLENIFKYDLLNGKKLFQQQEMYTALELSLDEIWKSLRKSYRSIINKEKKKSIVEGICSKEDWKECKNLHIEVSGRQTRSDRTWDIQWDMINAKTAKVFFIREEDKIIGFSLFYRSKDLVTYAVGAYDRSLFASRPISHILIWSAIEFFKQKHVKYLYLGDLIMMGVEEDSKLKSINHFKQGFANYHCINFSSNLN